MVRYVAVFIGVFFVVFSAHAASAKKAPAYCHYYPHWSDCANNPDIKKIEAFVARYGSHADQYTAAFDWDGTLYDEQIKVEKRGKMLSASGASVWHLWGAKKLLATPNGEYDYLFPSYKALKADGKTVDYQKWHDNIEEMDHYLEGRYRTLIENKSKGVQDRDLPKSVYSKFSQTALFETGMTFNEFERGVHDYLEQYATQHYSFPKVFDVLNRLQVAGFHIWIITGSNAYYVAYLITDKDNGINRFYPYQVLPQCQALIDATRSDSSKLTPHAFFSKCTIAGNSADWPGGDGRFSRSYDDRNFDDVVKYHRVAVDHYGKWLAAKHLAKITHAPLVFFAGNSDGDYSLMRRILANDFSSPYGTMGLFVQPDAHGGGDLKYLLNHECSPGQCIEIEDPQQ